MPLPTVSEDCASTLVEYGSLSTGDRKRVALIASPALTLMLGPAFRVTLLLRVTTLMLALVTWAEVPHWKLSRQLACCMGSMLTSHLRAMYDAAVKNV